MAMDAAAIWRQCFADWPADLPRRGVVVTAFAEQIPFESFAVSDHLLLIERRAPDTVGARTVLIAFQFIQAVKIVDVTKAKSFASMGFAFPPSKK
jgi:hypothetical protein